MKFPIDVRITNTMRCPEGYYAIFNGKRLWFKARSKAIGAVESFLELQRIQVVSVRQYAERVKR